MDLKKIEEKNPGWSFKEKVSAKASKAVLKSAIQSDLDIDSYNQKYVAQVKKKKGFTDTSKKVKLNDKGWRMVKKEAKERNTDSPEDPKAGFYDAEGNEVASQG